MHTAQPSVLATVMIDQSCASTRCDAYGGALDMQLFNSYHTANDDHGRQKATERRLQAL